jgi:alpha-1,2-mannosyltransferase
LSGSAGREAGATERGGLSEVALLALAAIAVPLVGWAFWALVLRLGSNDFHDYWLAGRLVLEGHSPYDVGALRELAAREHLSLQVGGGYSYPLPFALVMVPFAALPFGAALVAFNSLSLAAFGLAVAAWILWAHGRSPNLGRRRLALALGAGLYPPVYGTVVNGQANLILIPLLALGVACALEETRPLRRFGGGLTIGLAAIVKLVPGVALVPFALGRRFDAAAGLVLGAFGALVAAVAVIPWAASGSGGLASLLDADDYYTNQSINGFVSRLALPTARTAPLWDHGFDPGIVMLAATAAFGLITLALLWRARDRLRSRRGMALGLAFALVAGTIGAPKNSFWNEAFVLVAVGLLLAVETPDLRFGRLGRLDGVLLATWFGAALVWTMVWAMNLVAGGPLAPIVTLLWSSSLYGLLALWWLMARRLFAGDGHAVRLGAARGEGSDQSAGTIS